MRGAGVLATARKHLQIQYAVAALLPAPLGSVCQVGKLENQRLLLVVPGPAHAAKLRQLAPRIAQSLADQGWNLNEIAVKVQAGLPKPGARQPKPPKEAQPLGDTALGAFETLHQFAARPAGRCRGEAAEAPQRVAETRGLCPPRPHHGTRRS